MIEYRFFRIDKTDRIQGQPRFFICADDTSARLQARKLGDGCAIEIWDCERKVAYIASDEQHLTERATISA